MKLCELPQNQQDVLEKLRDQFKGHIVKNDAWGFTVYNELGTRRFSAVRRCIEYNNTKTGYHRGFGGGNYWVISYNQMCWQRSYRRDPLGGKELWLGWALGKSFGRITNEAGEVLEIPKEVGTKAEVLAFYKKFLKFREDFPQYDPAVVSIPLAGEIMAEYQDENKEWHPVEQ